MYYTREELENGVTVLDKSNDEARYKVDDSKKEDKTKKGKSKQS